MKKLTALLLALVLIFALCACGSNGNETADDPALKDEEQPIEISLQILMEKDDSMKNTYSLLAVNPDAPFASFEDYEVSDVEVNTVGADALINWMLSEGADLAADFGVEEYGENLFYKLDGAPTSTADIPKATDETKLIRLSTTTSVNDSGLLAYLLPIFEKEYGYEVDVVSAGTGKAIANAKSGNADLIFVHAKAQEEAFIADGFARVIEGQTAERLSFMYNFFVLVGPKDDPAGVKDAADVAAAFKAIADSKSAFVSRGDGSGTHTKELALWEAAGLAITAEPESFADYVDWYQSANAGMGACLAMADQEGAYLLSDKATFLTFQANPVQADEAA